MKQLLSEKMLMLSKGLGLNKNDVKLIINSFLAYKYNEILDGREVRIADIVEIVPENIYDRAITTIAYVSKIIAQTYNFPYNTVQTVINTYISIQKEQILIGNAIDFRGIVKIKPVVENGIIIGIHSSISAVITDAVRNNSRVGGVRVHTSKAFKLLVYNKKVRESNIIVDDFEDLTFSRLQVI